MEEDLIQKMKNLFSDIPERTDEELVQTLIETPSIRVERIVSRGHRSPDGFWYDQEREEHVFLLRGRAELLFEDGQKRVVMGPGDHLRISSRERHRVEWTDPDKETVWLAIHYG